MKLFYYFLQYDSNMYMWQNNHFIDELTHHGIEIVIFNPLQYESLEQANEKARLALDADRYDLFMTGEPEQICFIETVQYAKDKGIPTLLYCFDSLMTPLRHKRMAPLFDVVMISQKDSHGYFHSYNSNVIVSHYAANPYFFQMQKSVTEQLSLCFPGTPYGSRMVEIKKLAEASIPISLYYNKEKKETDASQEKTSIEKEISDFYTPAKILLTLLRHPEGRKVIAGGIVSKFKSAPTLDFSLPNIEVSPAVNLKETNEIYAKHALALSVGIGRQTGYLKDPIQIVHLRNFEIPMCGGVQFCQYFEELSECFEEDKEIIFYRSKEEMIEKARFYLAPEQEKARTAIRLAARKRAEQEHTWFNRFNAAFKVLGIDPKK